MTLILEASATLCLLAVALLLAIWVHSALEDRRFLDVLVFSILLLPGYFYIAFELTWFLGLFAFLFLTGFIIFIIWERVYG